MSIESVMPSSHLILCRPLLLPSIPPSIRVSEAKVTPLCRTLRPHTVHGILQARILEWVAFPFSRDPLVDPDPGIELGLPLCSQILYQLSHKGSPRILVWVAYPFSSESSLPRNRTRVSCIAGRFFTS